MKIGDILYGMGILILAYLILTHGPAMNRLLYTSVAGANTLTRTLQGR